MNFNQLKYIISIDKHRNFARAAEHCEIAQSTLSKEIQRLEKEFNVTIFDRSRHPVVSTLKGADLIQQAEIILEEQERFTAIANKRKNRPTGNFKLGVLSMLAPYLLPLFTQEITRKYPELNLTIFEMGPLEMTEHFEAGTLDGAISIAPFHKAGYYETSLFEEEFVLYVGREHHLSLFPSVKWADIPLDELILPEDMKTYLKEQKSDIVQPPISDRNLKNLNFQHGSLETIRKFIDRNGGLTLIPQLACLYMGERRLEMIRHIDAPALTRTINFVAPRGFQKNRLSKVILQEIINSIPPDFKWELEDKMAVV